jgi:hypothetical protein
MSAWRILVKNLYGLGRPATLREFDEVSYSRGAVKAGIQDAKALGLLRTIDRQRFEAVYELTERGRALCEGRLAVYRGQHPNDRTSRTRTFAVCATWLLSFPGSMS